MAWNKASLTRIAKLVRRLPTDPAGAISDVWRIYGRRGMIALASALFSPLTLLSAVWLRAVRAHLDSKASRSLMRAAGTWPLLNHYYEPISDPRRLPADYDEENELPGIDLDAGGQLSLLRRFFSQPELSALPVEARPTLGFYLANEMFSGADAGFYYSFLRMYRPRRIVEIGSGFSTRLAVAATNRTREDDPSYACQITCIEPYENPWLKQLPVELRREPLEETPNSIFDSLERSDILFIDSSHIIRPNGDVTRNFLRIRPRLKPGVFVHVHDIFTPWNYPRAWIESGRLWNEQQLLEAFLSLNSGYRVVAGLAYLCRRHPQEVLASLPCMKHDWSIGPSSFWIQRT